MKISVIGSGYAGLSAAVGFAKKGIDVTCVDIDQGKVDKINRGESPIYEHLMDEYLKGVFSEGRLRATTDLKQAIADSDIGFICVPTPSREDGSISLDYIEQASRDIGSALKEKEGYFVVVVKSTVVPGTTEGVVIPNLEFLSGKKAGEHFGVCMNPEFLREGKALEDFLNPDRTVIGSLDKKSGDFLEHLYSNFQGPVVRTSLKTAEMIKYVSNSLLSTKISFANEIGNICKRMGIDVYDVMRGVGLDKRMSPHFLQAGIGFGGSCFPKDVKALVSRAREMGYEPGVLKEVIRLNEEQPYRITELLKNHMSPEGKRIAVLGLAFKPETDDIREAPSIKIIRELLNQGAAVYAYDPKAMENMKSIFPGINYCESKEEALRDSDACLILTDWEEFKGMKDEDFKSMKNRVIIEGRRVLDPESASGFEGVSW